MVEDKPQIYKQGRLTFIITPQKIVIKTGIGQTFFLRPKAHYWRRRLKIIEAMIKLGEIRNLEELSNWCASGNVEWVDSQHVYDIDKLEQEA